MWQGQTDPDTECPNLNLPQFEKYFTAFNFYKAGFLPHEGGWLNQPNTFIDVMQIILKEESTLVRQQIEQQRQQ